MSARYRIEPLADHDRSAFSCGDTDLDRYFREVVSQDVRRRAATAFVAVDATTGVVDGFYTLSAADVDRRELPAADAAKAPRYARVPAVLLGRLAVAQSRQGEGLGDALLADAFERAIVSGVGVHLMLVQPKTDRARSFYSRWGFLPLGAPSKLLFLPLATAVRLLGG